jgi:predicted KAP-like P-loop ATPase
MWSDHESDIDYLNFQETSELISELVSNPSLRPISIGIFGGWGSGKSTLVKLSKSCLEDQDDYIIVDFDAWLYQDYDDARSALLEAVAKKLYDESEKDSGKLAKAKSLLKRINKFRAMGLLVEGGAMLMGTPAFGVLYKGIASAEDIVSGEGDDEDLESTKAAVNEVKKLASGLVSGPEHNTPPQEITAFRNEFSELLTELNKTLVVYVDNLDRCLPKNAVLTLEAIRLVLFMPNTAFIIAADEDMVRHAVSEHYKTSQDRLINDYLDKLIQVPVHVPRLGVAEVTSYAFLLLSTMIVLPVGASESVTNAMQDSLRGLWKKPLISSEEIISSLEKSISLDGEQKQALDEAYKLASRLSPLLAKSKRVAGNPRIVKRLLNTVWMRASIAEKRGMPTSIDKALIAKVSLFERCMSNSATTELYRLINDAQDGMPELIKGLEGKEVLTPTDLPDAWEDIEFINNWIKLEPKLDGVDLRAVAYLARETLPIKLSTDGLSVEAAAALTAMTKAKNLSSPSLNAAIKKIPTDEHKLVMDALIEHLSKTTDWSKKPDGFAGAIALARKSVDASSALRAFIATLGGVPKWMNVLLKNDDWWTKGA